MNSPSPIRRSEPNQLGGETSPYLLQHAFNPVDWFPWDETALAQARELNRPIFLSIGYSACHWCHVMEHESFEDPEIARLMNELFVNIKVDREERPDLDQIYMTAVQLMTGRGGWPMSVFLTPDLKPFYGGTYWPPHARSGMPGFRDILKSVDQAWKTRNTEITASAERLTAAMIESSSPRGNPSPLNDVLLEKAAQALRGAADRRNGGFGSAPKFPHPMDLRVLLRAWKRFGDQDALEVVTLTLDKMANGGIYDHLGGGFHRYSTDAHWLAPHFEKMLYDNALLVPVYLEAFQITGQPAYAQIVRETLDYVLREMTQPEGGFYSTQDADSEGVEGRFFVWQEADILDLLGPEEGRIFCYCYDVSARGNWEESNILNRPKSPEQAAQVLGIDVSTQEEILARCRQKLFDVRSKRIWPGRDDKVLAAWNGLMASAMSQAALVLEEPRYVTAARDAARFLSEQMRTSDGRLLHAYKDGRARFNGYLDDYACWIDGLIDVYQATHESVHLQTAISLAETLRALFSDEVNGGFYYTSHDHEQLISRQKDLQDNATPAGNSMAATALLRLGRLCGRTDFEDLAEQTLNLLSGMAADYPMAAGQTLIALDFFLGPTSELVLAEGTDAQETEVVIRDLYARFLPNKVVIRKGVDMADTEIPSMLAPLLRGKASRNDQATMYLCQHGTCGLPSVGKEAITNALVRLTGR